ncbi:MULTISPECIES: APC family permease [unclassified Pseudomonas]|uniref:APC family permease n=1 Tax=unclassified Pseudomonas TaxID=196821 RepID=UPI000BCF97B8|nr:MULTISPECIES: APC family permease [unclassified Pseudomonas]PVZ15530.1 amino acid/polyamine/organocation transporter (APC superfamily) [Pseudomonas sp. URIL14HWK12:I12]PVZ24904.1 amino acid/polyamine/organocation transporter (APC superfamily) [Pseudomonas sp. URIL14HWK12:I10]PVZ34750.1 amino acid/polyamine/organocation transporter (APC superfamily) [Pseudomonas sp. URIL14HWK12:I11]SNZ09163.1 amino acid/polyamine/organocation transporter, APC superfamily [Pseudomonas sp. URIL14HWK12:I9]
MPASSETSALSRTLSVPDVVAITVSSVTPASSVFVIAPFAIAQAGTGVIWAFALGGLLALMFALCYAELGRAHSAAGGEYVFAKRVFGGLAGYATFLTVLAMLLFIPPVLATGAATYLNAALGTGFDSQAVALVIVVASYGLGILNIKLNAWVTGACLFLEVAALMVIVVLGFGHAQQPVSALLHPQALSNGVLSAAPWALVVGAIGTALFSFNGYGGAVLLAEDMKCAGRGIPKAVLWSVVLVVSIEIVPLVALLVGAPSLEQMLASPDPIGYLLTAHGNQTLSRLVSAGIFLSVFNAIVALVIQIGRVIYSSGRDQLWVPGMNRAFTRIHPKWQSPWLATLFLAVPSAALSFSSNLSELTSFTVLLILCVYLVVGLCALFSRVLRRDREHPYRMPLWPLPALVAVTGAGYLLLANLGAASSRDIFILVGILGVSMVLYGVYGKASPAFQKL